jgi:hypothetical protein
MAVLTEGTKTSISTIVEKEEAERIALSQLDRSSSSFVDNATTCPLRCSISVLAKDGVPYSSCQPRCVTLSSRAPKPNRVKRDGVGRVWKNSNPFLDSYYLSLICF